MKHKLTPDFIAENKANENYNNKIKFFRPFFWLFLDFYIKVPCDARKTR